MKHKAIEKTVDMHPGLTPTEREKLFIESRKETKKKENDKKQSNGTA